METLQFIAYLTDGRASYLPPCSLLFTHQAKLGFWEKSSLSGIMDKVKDKNKTGEISSSGHTQPVFLQTQENIPLWRALLFIGQQLSGPQIKLHFPAVSPFA